MTTLAKRMTVFQRRLFKAVRGAVRNTLDAHRGIRVPDHFAQSVAKRAAGTLSAQWPEALAAGRTCPSEMPEAAGFGRDIRQPQPSQTTADNGIPGYRAETPAGDKMARRSLRIAGLLRRELGILAGEARRAGNLARFDGIADALRVLSRIVKEIPATTEMPAHGPSPVDRLRNELELARRETGDLRDGVTRAIGMPWRDNGSCSVCPDDIAIVAECRSLRAALDGAMAKIASLEEWRAEAVRGLMRQTDNTNREFHRANRLEAQVQAFQAVLESTDKSPSP